ncbi:hypothetical protein [uncultured Gemmiger sp.]|uniref:hypothetical protein n=1 Tax=uncultured Gemmiger sp. TaxID=1623490 RepID=UPI0025E44327|nr:hypothetical protein [uncultured Gemmiger sp.]
MIKSDLGAVTAYADAVKHGYTGTREDFGKLLAGAGQNLADAVAAKEAAEAAAGSAGSAAQTATDAAGTACQAAGAATNAAGAASTSAGAAAQSAEAAETAQQGAENAAKRAVEAKTGADNALKDAGTAKEAASNYADAAADSATAAATSETKAANSASAAAGSAAAAAQTKAEVGTLGDEKKQALQDEGTAQQAAIEEKGQDTLATIPENYTQTVQEVSQLKEATAKLKDGKISKFYASSQGNTNLPDSDDGRIMDLTLYGKSEQKQYAGYQLLPNNTEFSVIGNTTYTWKNVNLISGKTYILKNNIQSKTSGSFILYGVDKDATRTQIAINTVSKLSSGLSFVAKDNYFEILIYFNQASNEEEMKLMLEEGSTAHDFEPYVGGIPSPNPEYPQEIKSVVNPVVTISDGADKQQTATLPYTLNAIPVSSGGNITIDGQQYIADYVDVERGKLVRMVDSSKLDTSQSIIDKTDWLLVAPTETDLTADEIAAFKALVSYYPVTNVSTTSDQLDGYTVFNYPISLAKGYDYIKQQLGDTRDYLYGIDLMTAEAYVNSEYAAALAEIEV